MTPERKAIYERLRARGLWQHAARLRLAARAQLIAAGYPRSTATEASWQLLVERLGKDENLGLDMTPDVLVIDVAAVVPADVLARARARIAADIAAKACSGCADAPSEDMVR